MQRFDGRIQKTNFLAVQTNILLNVISCNLVIRFEGFWGSATVSFRTERFLLLFYMFLYLIDLISIKYGKSAIIEHEDKKEVRITHVLRKYTCSPEVQL